MVLAVRIVVLVALAWFIWRVVTRVGVFGRAGTSAAFPCSSCQHCAKLFDDGVFCRFAGKETFKNEVHIANCDSFQRRA